MPTVYLIRHGQKEPTDIDPVLTQIGHEQAQKTGGFLKSFPITHIIASPRARTQQTAQHIAQALQLTVSTDTRLQERMDYADYSHLSRPEFFKEWTQSTQNRMVKPRFGDSSISTGKRIEAVVSELEEEAHVALITHGGSIADFLRNVVAETNLQKLLTQFPEGIDYGVNECSVTRIIKNGSRYIISDLHCTSHL